MVNFLALLGWSYDDKTELFTNDQLIEAFSLERVSKSGAVFNLDKLDWMNGHYIREAGGRSARRCAPGLLAQVSRLLSCPRSPTVRLLVQIVPLIKERLKTLADAAERIPFFFRDDFDYEPSELVQRKMDGEGTLRALNAAVEVVGGVDPFDGTTLEAKLRSLADDLDIKVGQLARHAAGRHERPESLSTLCSSRWKSWAGREWSETSIVPSRSWRTQSNSTVALKCGKWRCLDT